MKKALDPRLRAALSQVQDPEMGIDVVRLGLIYGAWLDADGMARVTMTTTTRGCPLAGFLKEAVAIAAGAVEGVTAVAVTLTYEPVWEPAMIAAE